MRRQRITTPTRLQLQAKISDGDANNDTRVSHDPDLTSDQLGADLEISSYLIRRIRP